MRWKSLIAGAFAALLLAALPALDAGAQMGGGVVNPSVANPTPGYFNLDPAKLPHWRKVVANVRAGTGRGTLLFMGDSTSAGTGGGTGGTNNSNGAFQRNWPTQVSKLLGGFVATSNNTFFDTQAVTADVTYNAYDPRVTLGTGWTNLLASGAKLSLAGQGFHFATGAPGTLSFTPLEAFDTLVVYYISHAFTASATVNVDGGGTCAPGGAINANAVAAFHSATCTVTKGIHTVNIVAANDGIMDFSGIKTYDSTAPAIDIIQADWKGSTVLDFLDASQAWSAFNLINPLAPDLCVINMTINDSNQTAPSGVTLGFSAPAPYQTNLQALVAQCQLTGDVILTTGPPSSTSFATNGTLARYVAGMRSVAAATSSPMVDLTYIFKSYAFTNAIQPYNDSLHLTGAGYQDVAQIELAPLVFGLPSAGSATGSGMPVRAASPVFNSQIQVTLPTTVAALPTCNAAASGTFRTVTDATTPTYNAALTGGGAVPVPVYCDGTSWKSH